MSINAISSAMAATIYIQRNSSIRLPDELLEKLELLGIDPTTITSRSQAEKIIDKILNSDSSSTSSVGTVSVNNSEDGEDDSSIRERAERLADKVGVSYSDQTTTTDLVTDIQDAIDAMFALAANSNDKGIYFQATNYQDDLNEIIRELPQGSGESEKKIYSYLEVLAKYNKAALGIEDNKKEE